MSAERLSNQRIAWLFAGPGTYGALDHIHGRFKIRTIAIMVFQFRVVAGTP